jgi:hypothetical protein
MARDLGQYSYLKRTENKTEEHKKEDKLGLIDPDTGEVY